MCFKLIKNVNKKYKNQSFIDQSFIDQSIESLNQSIK